MTTAKAHKATFPVFLFLVALTSLPIAMTMQLPLLAPPLRILGALFGVSYILWVVVERRITFGTAREPKSNADRGTLHFYGVARVATMTAALFLRPSWQTPGVYLVVALVVFVTGIALRLTAIEYLGRFYSHQVRTVDAHRVVQSGPYRLIRHPAYAGMLLAHLGFVAFFCNPVSVAAMFGLFLPAVVLRILVEEQILVEQVPGYAEYARSRKRLIPQVW